MISPLNRGKTVRVREWVCLEAGWVRQAMSQFITFLL